MSLWAAFHKRGLSIALSRSILDESPMKSWCRNWSGCLVLINGLQIPHPCALSWPLGGRMKNPVNLRDEPSAKCPLPSSRRAVGLWRPQPPPPGAL